MDTNKYEYQKPTITVTGVDERTDISQLAKLDCEVGILYTFDPEGRNRYPRLEWIVEASKVLPRLAIHVCGNRAKVRLWGGWIDELVEPAQRIQVNGVVHPEMLRGLLYKFRKKTMITQHGDIRNHSLFHTDYPTGNHAVLVDGSGGRGITPESWSSPGTDKPVGLAGGIGPDNITHNLTAFAAMERKGWVRPGWWVDMEGKLRVDDWFSIDRAKECILMFHQFFKDEK